MSSVPISDLPAVSTLTGASIVPVVQSGVTRRTTVAGLWGPFVTLDLDSSGPNVAGVQVTVATGKDGIRVICNGGGDAVNAFVNSGAGRAIKGTSVSTTQPAAYFQSTGYYTLTADMINDLGSDLLNAGAVAINALSTQGYTCFFQQGGSPGSPGDELTRNNTRSAVYIVRDIDALNGFDFTAPIFRIEGSSNVATTTGGIMDAVWSGNTVFSVGQTGRVNIDQQTNDDEILSLRSTGDVAHGMTGLTTTSTFGAFSKAQTAAGGLAVNGYTDTGNQAALVLGGHASTPIDGTRSTAGIGVIQLDAAAKDGTGGTTVGADKNMVVFSDNGTVRYIFDSDGSAHADVEWTTFDKFDDLQALEALDMEFQRRRGDPIRAEFGSWLAEHRDILQREKIVNFYDNGPRAMLNTTRLAMLHTGAIRQLGRRLEEQRKQLEALKTQLLNRPI